MTAPVEPARFSVRFAATHRAVLCRAHQTLLEAAEAAGLPLPFSCRQGLCGTCRSKLVSGRVDTQHRGGIRPRQIAMGYILVCCSRPLGDVVLDR
jgi:3-phenylpropionate/trans-cinnamate dioxygenase ferredoxin reductase subunit